MAQLPLSLFLLSGAVAVLAASDLVAAVATTGIGVFALATLLVLRWPPDWIKPPWLRAEEPALRPPEQPDSYEGVWGFLRDLDEITDEIFFWGGVAISALILVVGVAVTVGMLRNG